MTLENKIKDCVWKGYLDIERRIYGKIMEGYDLVIQKDDSFLYNNCKDCNGKNKECRYYFPKK